MEVLTKEHEKMVKKVDWALLIRLTVLNTKMNGKMTKKLAMVKKLGNDTFDGKWYEDKQWSWDILMV